MRTADVVIGANLGDEGKGLITDYLAAPYNNDALVVRFCGGAQAGHTVTTPDGKRHVFNHFGSGSLCGAQTYLSRFFACNPILFLAEKERLAKLGVTPKVFVDPKSPVTTPYDMMINQIVEDARGNKRHGSCGLGFGETIERNDYAGYALYFADLFNAPKLRTRLEAIRTQWVPARLRKLGVRDISEEWKERLFSESLLNRFNEDIEAFLISVRPATVSFISRAKYVVFEGAQGLLLDQHHEWFPHVTRSSTGLKNVASLATAAGIEELNVHYASRCYATRHGAGPLPHELAKKPYEKIVDLTNVPNTYQGTLRFGWLDLNLLQKTIEEDLAFGHGFKINPVLAMSCVDQIDDRAHFVHHGMKRECNVDAFLATAATIIPSSKLLASYGPTRATIRETKIRKQYAGTQFCSDISSSLAFA